jgi:predicted O-methyltransferase YrrM
MKLKKLAKLAIEKKSATQKTTELMPLLNLLKRRKIKTVVEIGTEKGGTLYLWCKLSQPDALIVSIDLPGGPFGGGYTLRDIKTFRTYGRKKQTLYFLRKDSHNLSTKKKLMEIIKERKIDFLFIDGDHRYSGVKKDFRMYAPLVKQNGLIVLHDILYHPKVPQCKVHKFWHEIKKRFQYREFIDRQDDRGWGKWGGIGVLYYKTGSFR